MIGGGVGVGVGEGVTDGSALNGGVGPTIGVGRAPGAGVGVAVAPGVAGGLVTMGAGGFTCAGVIANDANKQPAAKAAPQSEARLTRYAILASLRLTAEASNVL